MYSAELTRTERGELAMSQDELRNLYPLKNVCVQCALPTAAAREDANLSQFVDRLKLAIINLVRGKVCPKLKR